MLEAQASASDRPFVVFNATVSVAAFAFLALLLYVHRGLGGAAEVDLAFLPAVNAGLNATAASLLVAGWIAIRRKRARLHKYLMVSAFAASALFFVCYALYHYAHGDTHYQGTGPLRAVYFAVLASHVVLSASVPPFALTALYLAVRRRFAAHKRVTRIALPVWLYVSVTGVVIFFMLRAAAGAP